MILFKLSNLNVTPQNFQPLKPNKITKGREKIRMLHKKKETKR